MIKTTRLKTSQVPKNITYDLTPQVDGVTQTFELPEKVYNLDQHYVLFNGQVYRNDGNHTFYTISADGMELTTLFDEAPRPGASYVLQFVKTESSEGENAVTKDYVDGKVADEATAREDADIALGQRIDTVVAASDVKDIVGTHADLESYDTSTLGDNDIIKVLSDETHGGAIYYYRWNASAETFAAIGSEGPYYTKSETNTLLSAKQNTLTAGENITIENDVISATGGSSIGLYTTYGQNEDGAMTQKATTDLVYTDGDPTKINIGDNGAIGGTNSIVIGSEDSGTITGKADQIIIGHNITSQRPSEIGIGHNVTLSTTDSDTVHNAIAIGDGASALGTNTIAIGYLASTSGNVNNMAIGNNARSNHSYTLAIGMDAIASQYDAMAIGHSASASYNGSVAVGVSAGASGTSTVAIGKNAKAYTSESVAVGTSAVAGRNGGAGACNAFGDQAQATENGSTAVGFGAITYKKGSVALGATSRVTRVGTVSVGNGDSDQRYGYLGTSVYRVIENVHDGEQLHDAATVAQGNTLSTTAPTTATVGVLGQLYTDTTNMHTYQLTAIDTTDPDNPSYTWTQRW